MKHAANSWKKTETSSSLSIKRLRALAGELEGLPQKPEEIFNFVRRAQELQVQLAFAMESDDRNTVFWIERRGDQGV